MATEKVVVIAAVFAIFLGCRSSLPIAARGRRASVLPSLADALLDVHLLKELLPLSKEPQVNAAPRLPILPRTSRQTCAVKKQSRRLAEVQCDGGFLNALSDLEGAECSYPITFRLVSNRFSIDREFPECGRDSDDVLCGIHDVSDNSPYSIAFDVIEECIDDQRNCSNRCRETLENFSNRFGCCIHSTEIMEDSDTIRSLTPQLWEDCGVTLPSPCDNAPQALAPLNANARCSYTCSLEQFLALFCKYQAARTIEILEECGDEERALLTEQLCGFNQRGDFCATVGNVYIFSFFLNPQNELDDEYVFDVYNKCIAFAETGICPTECRDALVEAKQKFGCCFNNINQTALGSFLFSVSPEGLRSFLTNNDLWTVCVVETPGFCGLPEDTSMYDDLTQCSVCEVALQQGSGSDDFPLVIIVASVAGVGTLLIMIAVPILIYCYYCRRRSRKIPVLTSTAHTPGPNSIPHHPTPHHPNNNVVDQRAGESVGTVHYYDYIPPLSDQSPPPPHSNTHPSPQITTPSNDIIDARMTTNAAYNPLSHSGDRHQRTPNDRTHRYRDPVSSLPRPPLSPPNEVNDNEYLVGPSVEQDVEYISMVPNPAHSSMPPHAAKEISSGTDSEEVVMYI